MYASQQVLPLTSQGRRLIKKVNSHVVEKHGGKVVYGDTDSSMFIIPGITNANANERGHALAEELSALFPPPLKLEFEKAMRMLCLKKKKYAAFLIEPDGSYDVKRMLYRGIVIARRDNCSFLREVYNEILIEILRSQDIKKCLSLLFDNLLKLLNHSIGLDKLKIVTTIADTYKQPNSYRNGVFKTCCELQGRPIQPGERISYIISENVFYHDNLPSEIKSENLGLRMRNIDYFDRRKENIDYLYYIKQMFQAPIDQLFYVAFPSLKEKEKYQPKTKSSKEHNLAEPIKLICRLIHDSYMEKKQEHKKKYRDLKKEVKILQEIQNGKKKRGKKTFSEEAEKMVKEMLPLEEEEFSFDVTKEMISIIQEYKDKFI